MGRNNDPRTTLPTPRARVSEDGIKRCAARAADKMERDKRHAHRAEHLHLVAQLGNLGEREGPEPVGGQVRPFVDCPSVRTHKANVFVE